jgi:sugar phosphate isomerase/epimerase
VQPGQLALVEPFHPMFLAERSAIVTLAQANRPADEFADPSVAIAVDTYHVWWDPALGAELERAAGRIAAVHVADWLVPTPSVLTGRGLPGDGVIPLGDLLGRIELTGFAGPVEVEVLNPQVWARPVGEVAHDVRDRMARQR